MKWRLFGALIFAKVAWPGLAFAQAQSVGPVAVTAVVDQLQQLSYSVFQGAPSPTNPPITPSAMNFGTLVRPTNTDGTPGALRGGIFFQVLCSINLSGAPYTVTHGGSDLVAGTNRLPRGAWVFTPGLGLPGGTLGTTVSASSATATWYNGTTGSAGNIEATYGLTDLNPLGLPLTDPETFILPTQAAGTYTGQVTWTLTPL